LSLTFQSTANRTSSPSVPILICLRPACEQNDKRLFEYTIEPVLGCKQFTSADFDTKYDTISECSMSNNTSSADISHQYLLTVSIRFPSDVVQDLTSFTPTDWISTFLIIEQKENNTVLSR
jgi:hypothetical protein